MGRGSLQPLEDGEPVPQNGLHPRGLWALQILDVSFTQTPSAYPHHFLQVLSNIYFPYLSHPSGAVCPPLQERSKQELVAQGPGKDRGTVWATESPPRPGNVHGCPLAMEGLWREDRGSYTASLWGGDTQACGEAGPPDWHQQRALWAWLSWSRLLVTTCTAKSQSLVGRGLGAVGTCVQAEQQGREQEVVGGFSPAPKPGG